MSTFIETIMRQARRLFEQGDLASATALLQQLTAAHAACAPALQLLGLVFIAQGDLRGAVRLLRQACVVEPENGPLRLHLARVEWKIGMPAQAAASYEQAIACGCACADMRADYAIALQALKQYAAATAQCELAIAEDPAHALAWSTMGCLHHAQNRFDAALRCHDRAVALAPDVHAWSAKAVTLDALNRLPEALACHDQALACAPADAAAWTGKGMTLAKRGLYQQALACLLEACRLDAGFAGAWSSLGAVLSACRRDDEALAAHDKAISLQPSCADFWLQRGKALMRCKREAEALASFNAAIRLEPAWAAAWHHRGSVLLAHGRLQEALESFDEAILLDPSDVSSIAMRDDALQQSATLALLEQIAVVMPCNEQLHLVNNPCQDAQGPSTADWRRRWPCPSGQRAAGTDAGDRAWAPRAGTHCKGVA